MRYQLLAVVDVLVQSFDNGIVIRSKLHIFASEINAALVAYRVTDRINMIDTISKP